MRFRVVHWFQRAHSEPDTAYLERDSWNDWWEFETLFSLIVVSRSGAVHHIGGVKIGQFAMAGKRPELPEEFDALGPDSFSVGQDANYYETLFQLEDLAGEEILSSLNDLAFDLRKLDSALGEPVTTRSLLRSVPEWMLRRTFSRLAHGLVPLTSFHFEYTFPEGAGSQPPTLEFDVTPTSHPPTNIHVLIGRNGVGKTSCLNRMTHALLGTGESDAGSFEVSIGREDGSFANLVSVTFSAFDRFEPIDPDTRAPGTMQYPRRGGVSSRGARRCRFNGFALASCSFRTPSFK